MKFASICAIAFLGHVSLIAMDSNNKDANESDDFSDCRILSSDAKSERDRKEILCEPNTNTNKAPGNGSPPANSHNSCPASNPQASGRSHPAATDAFDLGGTF
ncbi:MAG TPA: hypothetical protein VEL47_07175 [Myxococcota bacterium]|nr:hypothetical protein [Myxococcota bacterium]